MPRWPQILQDNADQAYYNSYYHGILLTTMHKLCLDSIWMKTSPQQTFENFGANM